MKLNVGAQENLLSLPEANEYELIRSRISEISVHMDKLSEDFELCKHEIKKVLLNSLLTGIPADMDVDALARNAGICFLYPYYTVALFASVTPDTLEALYVDYLPKDFLAYCVEQSSGLTAVIFNAAVKDVDCIRESTRLSLDVLLVTTDCYVALSALHEGNRNICRCFEEASTALEYRSFYANKRLLLFEEIYPVHADSELDMKQMSRKGVIVAKAKQYIAGHLDSQLSLTSTAEYAGVSPKYLSAVFKEITGGVFQDYVRLEKLRAADQRLRETGCTVESAANSVGFASTSYFIRQYKEYYGSTPGKI